MDLFSSSVVLLYAWLEVANLAELVNVCWFGDLIEATYQLHTIPENIKSVMALVRRFSSMFLIFYTHYNDKSKC